MAELGDCPFEEFVELVLEPGVTLGQGAVVETFGLEQDLLLLPRDLLEFIALALHFPLHAAHARSHLRALRVLQGSDHLRHLVKQLARQLPRALDIALRQLLLNFLKRALHFVKTEALHRLGVHKIVGHLLRQLRRRPLQGIERL